MDGKLNPSWLQIRNTGDYELWGEAALGANNGLSVVRNALGLHHLAFSHTKQQLARALAHATHGG